MHGFAYHLDSLLQHDEHMSVYEVIKAVKHEVSRYLLFLDSSNYGWLELEHSCLDFTFQILS